MVLYKCVTLCYVTTDNFYLSSNCTCQDLRTATTANRQQVFMKMTVSHPVRVLLTGPSAASVSQFQSSRQYFRVDMLALVQDAVLASSTVPSAGLLLYPRFHWTPHDCDQQTSSLTEQEPFFALDPKLNRDPGFVLSA